MQVATLTDVIRAMRTVSSTEHLWHLVRSYYMSFGVTKISYHRYRGVTEQEETGQRAITVLAEGFSQDWVCHYVREKLFLVDPIPDLARLATSPFFWSDVGQLTRLTPEQRGFVDQLEQAEIGDGLAMHVYGPNLRNAYVGLGFGGARPDLSATVITEFQCVAQMGHLRFCEWVADHEARRFDLAPREREILHWIARGKSNASIATILQISPHTIDTLTRRMFDKLGVSDRTSAAIRGVGAGLILPG